LSALLAILALIAAIFYLEDGQGDLDYDVELLERVIDDGVESDVDDAELSDGINDGELSDRRRLSELDYGMSSKRNLINRDYGIYNDDAISIEKIALNNQDDQPPTIKKSLLNQDEESDPNPTNREFKLLSWITMGPIVCYCILAFTEMTYSTLIPLFFSSPPSAGGLGFNSRKTSLYIVIVSITNLSVSITNLVDVVIVVLSGSFNAFSISMTGFIPCLLLLPINAYIQGFNQTLGITIILGLMGVCEAIGYQSIILAITDSQASENLGKTHGIATSLAAVSRTVAPVMVGLGWDWSRVLGWDWYAFCGGAGTALMGAIASSGSLNFFKYR
jgi:hypothetical protein